MMRHCKNSVIAFERHPIPRTMTGMTAGVVNPSYREGMPHKGCDGYDGYDGFSRAHVHARSIGLFLVQNLHKEKTLHARPITRHTHHTRHIPCPPRAENMMGLNSTHLVVVTSRNPE